MNKEHYYLKIRSQDGNGAVYYRFSIFNEKKQFLTTKIVPSSFLPDNIISLIDRGYDVYCVYDTVGNFAYTFDFRQVIWVRARNGLFDQSLEEPIEGETDTQGVYEEIDHPHHYNWHPRGIECIDVIEAFENVNVAFAIKHLWRLGKKPGVDALKDLDKAIWYLQRERERLTHE